MTTAHLLRLDAVASEPQYADHLLPLWLRVPSRRTFWVRDDDLGDRVAASAPGADVRVLDGRKLDAPVIVASAKDLAVTRRRRAPAVAYMEHGAGQSYRGDRSWRSHPSYAGGPGREKCGLILAPNGFAAARWRERYPGVPVHVIGATRRLNPPEDPGRSLLVVSFHWPGPIPELRTALPHYRASLALLREQMPLATHAHPRFASSVRAASEAAGIPFIPELRDVARFATVYAVDNSSTLWELGLTRPVIALNAPWYRRTVEHGLRFWSHLPAAVDTPGALLGLADRFLRGRETEEERAHRLRVCREVIPADDGAEVGAALVHAWVVS